MSSVSRTVQICNTRGLHARASAKLVKAAANFEAEIRLIKDGQAVDARSIMGLLMLGAGIGSQVEIQAEGEDAPAALEAIIALIEARFDEDC